MEKGYWRSSLTSDTLYKCPNEDACEGGFFPDQESPVKCKDGYQGVLCHDCVGQEKNGERRFMRVSQSKCSHCPNKVLNSIRIIFFSILIFCTVATFIFLNLRKTKETFSSLASRILVNYLHCVSASFSYNLAFPTFMTESMSPLQKLGESSETIVSFDCFIEDFKMNLFGSSEYTMKAFLSSIVPVVIAIIISVGFVVWKLIRKDKTSLSRGITVSIITLLYFFHPQLTAKALSFFKCSEIAGENRLMYDLEMVCWKDSHFYWAAFYWSPMFLCWVIGLPLLGIVFLQINRKKVFTKEFNYKYLVLYQGLTKRTTYWEMVNIIRKVCLLSINVFLPKDHPFYKATLGIIFLFLYSRLQKFIQPFKKKQFNKLEEREIFCSISTLYAGIAFLQNDIAFEVQLLVFCIIILANCYFFNYFIYLCLLELNYHS